MQIMKINKPKGTYDLFPEDSAKWQWAEGIARDLFEEYGFFEIRTPIFESTELFSRSIGKFTDIVEKQMYTFKDKKDRSLTLRPEATASVIRAYLEKGEEGALKRFYYLGPMFRYDRPQRGRFRQFSQIGVELFGVAHPGADSEIILLLNELFGRWGLKNFEIQLNSLGCSLCRKKYLKILYDYLKEIPLCADCERRKEKNTLRVLDCKNETCQSRLMNAPKITDYLCNDCSSHFEKLKNYLDYLKVPYSVNPLLVRGLDYYTRTVFELFLAKSGKNIAVAAGGRYDNLIEELGGRKTPAVGFAIGMERLMTNLVLPDQKKISFYFAFLGDEKILKEAIKLTQKLRKSKIPVIINYEARSLKNQLRQADKLGSKFVLILGPEEFEKNVVILRDMKNSTQEEIKRENLVEKIKGLPKEII